MKFICANNESVDYRFTHCNEDLIGNERMIQFECNELQITRILVHQLISLKRMNAVGNVSSVTCYDHPSDVLFLVTFITAN